MNIKEAVEALTEQYMREKDWPRRRALRKALAVVRRKCAHVEFPPPEVIAKRARRRMWIERVITTLWRIAVPAAWIFLGAGTAFLALYKYFR